jgi:hypothetical protein
LLAVLCRGMLRIAVALALRILHGKGDRSRSVGLDRIG